MSLPIDVLDNQRPGRFLAALYPQVRKELARRYPRHAWPEKPV